jgi:hypothetical protein
LAVLTGFATPAFAQSIDPDNGTGNVLPFSHKSTSSERQNRGPSGQATVVRHGSGTRLVVVTQEGGLSKLEQEPAKKFAPSGMKRTIMESYK